MYPWKFFRAGGADQVSLKTGEDIAHLAELDQKLWTALSCPTEGVRFDAKTLEMLDTDHDKRIRAPEILAAIEWLKPRLASFDSLIGAKDELPLSAFNTATEEGKAAHACAKQILKDLGKPDTQTITLTDLADTNKILAGTPFNGDGVIPPESATDKDVAQTLQDIMACCGSVKDCGGKDGISKGKADAFFAAVDARLAWRKLAKDDAALLPLGKDTATAAAALTVVSTKIDDYFTRCGLAAYDGRSAQPLSRSDADYAALAPKALTDSTPALADFPLAKIDAAAVLPLSQGLNPFWSAAMADACTKFFAPMGIKATLSREEWQKLKDKFAPYQAWAAAEAGKEIASLGDARLEKITADGHAKKIAALIEKDLSVATEHAKFTEVEQIIRYSANLLTLLENTVNMGRLYDPATSPIYRIGTLYLDGRACTLCFHVADAAAHSALATTGKCCLVYCDIKRPGSGEKRTLCAPVTAGVARTLSVGRNGVFYDLDGKDWEATVTQLVDHAICLKEAFWYPWRKMAQLVTEQIHKLLAAKQDAAVASGMTNINAVADATTKPAADATAPKKMEGAALASSVAAIGIAIGLIASAFGGVVSAVKGLPVWKTLLGVIAIILIVSLPSVILTWFKLRSRDLAPILNACGWAVNRRLGFSLRLGKLFTKEASLPPGSVRSLRDPYADKHPCLTFTIILILSAIITALICFTC